MSKPSVTEFHHLQGMKSLGTKLQEIVKATLLTQKETFLLFDFDRTLTNGFATPDEHLPMERRIRGGEHTLEALRLCKQHDHLIKMFIITARSPSVLTIQQLEASMMNCQNELAEIFLTDDHQSSDYKVEKFHGVQLAFKGHLYASDYSKSFAIRHLLTTKQTSNTVLHFFDDFVGNAFDVGVTEYPAGSLEEVHTYWWDTFEEEQLGFIGPITSFSSDFPYQDGTIKARGQFGLSPEESEKRKQWYLQYELKNNIKPKDMKLEAPPVQKLNLAKFQNLSFGGPPKRSPPTSDGTGPSNAASGAQENSTNGGST
jgi:hypothetical protein